MLIVLMGPVFGPVVGEYATIVFCALVGSLWPLSARDDLTRLKGAMLMLRLTLTASVLTSAVALVVHSKTGWPMAVLLSPVAFFLALVGDRWRTVSSVVFRRLLALFGGGPKA